MPLSRSEISDRLGEVGYIADRDLSTALWLMGRVQALAELAEPQQDQGALELDVRQAVKRRAVRSAASIAGRLRRKPAS